MLLISEAVAQTADAAQSQPAALLSSFAPIVLIIAVFYFLMIRPQQKKMKEHVSMVNSLKRGDRVVTSGGIIGSVARVEEGNNIIKLDLAPNVTIEVKRESISEVLGRKELTGTDNQNQESNVKKVS